MASALMQRPPAPEGPSERPCGPPSPAYLADVPTFTDDQLEACDLVEPPNEAALDRRLAELCREIRRRRPDDWAWQVRSENPYASLNPEVIETIVGRYRSGVPIKRTARELKISRKTIRKWYRRCRAEGIRQENGMRPEYCLEGLEDAA